jgi:hypothetical protein
MSQTQEQQQQEAGKVGKKFEENLKKITALLGGPKPLSGKKRLPKDAVGTLVEQLLKEKVEAAGVKFKTDLGELIEKKIAFDKAVAEEEKKLAKFKEDKMAEFNKSAQGILDQIEGIDEMTASYYSTLGQVAGASEQAK